MIMDRETLMDSYIEAIIDGMDHKDLWQYVYDNLADHLDKYSVDELITEVEDYYPHLLEESVINWVGCPTSWQGVTWRVEIGGDLCKYSIMNKTQMTDTLSDLQSFMFDTMCSAEMAVDWYCDRFEVNATDEVIDFVLDAHDAFFGNW